jgi:hypothetical protein
VRETREEEEHKYVLSAKRGRSDVTRCVISLENQLVGERRNKTPACLCIIEPRDK